jgi:hypothetical protein
MKIYRGVNCEMLSIIFSEKVIHPKAHQFEIIFQHNGQIRFDGSATYGKSPRNAVVGHQIDSSLFKTSGISTTPNLERAKFYALNNMRNEKGFILEFDTERIDKTEYQLIVVSEIVKSPKVPEDSEIILKRFDNKSIPFRLVTKILKVERTNGCIQSSGLP